MEIVANLLENAFKYSKKVEIGMAIDNEGIYVFDDGKKITKKEKEQIFQKGFRGSASKKKEGTGVGLFLAKKLSNQIGGDLILLENNTIMNLSVIPIQKKKNVFYLKLPTRELHK